MMKNLCGLIPSYNEAKTIGPIAKNLKDRSFAVYVVDDGSTDETALNASLEGAVVIRNEKNLGKGTALRRGFERILKDGYDMVLVMDGDDQHDVKDIAHLIRRMRETGASIVVGNRMYDTSSMPYIRRIVNRFMSSIISMISGQHIPDTQCGFRLIKRDVLEAIKLDASKYEIESEMIIKAARKGFKIESAPIKTVYSGQMSRINPFLDTLRFLMFIIKISFKP